MTFLNKTLWTQLGTDGGLRRISGNALPADYDNNSKYVLKVPVDNTAYPTTADYTAFESKDVYQSLVGTNYAQSSTIFGSFNFTGAGQAYFGVGLRSTNALSLLTSGYYAILQSDDLGARNLELRKEGVVPALGPGTVGIGTYTVGEPMGLRLLGRDSGATVKLDVQTTTDGITWITQITHNQNSSLLTSGNWFFRTGRYGSVSADSYILLDNCSLDKLSV